VDHFAHRVLEGQKEDADRFVAGLTDENWREIESHPWRGNVRELRNAVERAIAFWDGIPRIDPTPTSLGPRPDSEADPTPTLVDTITADLDRPLPDQKAEIL